MDCTRVEGVGRNPRKGRDQILPSGNLGGRSEQASQDGGVEGSYTTIGADGQLMEVRYRSGPEIGFVILNNDEVRQ